MDTLAQDGMPFIPLRARAETLAPARANDYASWLGASQHVDARDTIEAIGREPPDWLIVDHYGLDEIWEQFLKPHCRRLLVIDDLANRRHDCDSLLDQNLYPDFHRRYEGMVPARCQQLLGPQYALLREDFRELRATTTRRPTAAKRLLVFFGGVDAINCTGVAVEALASLGLKGVAIDIVIGIQHPRRGDIERACARNGFVCHVQTNKMAELMAAADLAAGAGGTASWERCCLGLPSILVAAADNQIAVCRALAEAGVADFLGEMHNVDVADWRVAFAKRLESPWLAEASSRASSLVDGLGVSRVLAAMGFI